MRTNESVGIDSKTYANQSEMCQMEQYGNLSESNFLCRREESIQRLMQRMVQAMNHLQSRQIVILLGDLQWLHKKRASRKKRNCIGSNIMMKANEQMYNNSTDTYERITKNKTLIRFLSNVECLQARKSGDNTINCSFK